jgi:hypothetical protein
MADHHGLAEVFAGGQGQSRGGAAHSRHDGDDVRSFVVGHELRQDLDPVGGLHPCPVDSEFPERAFAEDFRSTSSAMRISSPSAVRMATSSPLLPAAQKYTQQTASTTLIRRSPPAPEAASVTTPSRPRRAG